MKNRKIFCISCFFFSLSIPSLVNYALAAELNKTPAAPSSLAITSSSIDPPPTVEPPPVPPPPTVEPPPGNASLLAGRTSANFTPPSGWTLVRTEGFESGSLPTGEWTAGKFTTENKKSGSYAMRGYYTGSGNASARWTLSKATIGTFKEVYVSFWEYVEPQGRTNEEIHLFRFERRDDGNLIQQNAVMGFGGWNAMDMKIAQINECGNGGLGKGCRYYTDWTGRKNWSIGNWVQWEFRFRPNTQDASGNALNDGYAALWRNGVLVMEGTNRNLNGKIVMSGNMLVEVGGVYSKFKEWANSPTNTVCSPSVFSGVQAGHESNWDNPCVCPNQCPPSGYVPKFWRYIDDIIVMKR